MKIVPILSAVAIATFATATTASAQASTIVVPVDSILAGDTGTTQEVASATVDPALVGLECIVSLQSLNQFSVHPDNHLVVMTGDSIADFFDVEALDFDIIATAQPIVLGENITVDVLFGGDAFFSGGFDIEFDCSISVPGPTTTVPETTTTIEVSDTTTTVPVAPTTTDEPSVPILPDTTTTTAATTTTTTEPTGVIPATPTTTDPAAPVTTTPGSGTPDPRDVLPATGSNLTSLMLGAGFVLAGVGIVLGSRRRPTGA